VNRLTRLAALLLLSCCASASAQASPLPMALCAGWQGERVCELLHEDASVRMLRCTFPPGVGHEPHYHPPHFGYLLGEGGTMRITTEQGVQDRALSAGSHFASDAEVRHQALNIGQTTIRYLIVEKKYADERAPGAVAPGLCAAR
jgi:beta-alanine degradation protein BauB